jgi:hypothetical protein
MIPLPHKNKHLNHCADSGTGSYGTCNGGARFSPHWYQECPTCGKRVKLTKDGRLRVHGTYKKAQSL